VGPCCLRGAVCGMEVADAPDDLLQIAAAGQHPHLAAALADQAASGGSEPQEPLFDRAMTRILTGLLP
jgi:hypothetical protein